jgi:hypothetical protein
MEERLLATESAIQSSYIEWLNLQHPKIAEVTASIPNGGKRDVRYGSRLKREGLKKGFPDVGVFAPRGRYHGLFIEFKSMKGVARKEQLIVMGNLTREGYLCEVCKNLDEAIGVTKSYLLLSQGI